MQETTQELVEELKALVEKYGEAAESNEGGDEAEDRDLERMQAISSELELRRRAGDDQREARAAKVDAARRAIESGRAERVGDVPLARAAAPEGGSAIDRTDYDQAAKRGWLKDLATRAGVVLTDGNELSATERAAFTVTTGDTAPVVPVDLQNQIISLVDGSTALFGDVRRDAFKHQYEIVRHKLIKAGDAVGTDEAAPPASDEENVFDRIGLSGTEIKKTAKMSRKMAVQSMDGFESWLVSEIGGRLAVAANAFVIARMDDAQLGIAAANKISAKTSGTLAKTDLTGSYALLKTFGNPVPKGAVVYANSDVIWNHIANIEDQTGHSYFVNEKTEDPTVQGRIFGRTVKLEDALPDGVLLIGYPDLFRGNVFDGPSVDTYRATDGTQRTCFDGYMLYDGGLMVPEGFVKLTVGTAPKPPKQGR